MGRGPWTPGLDRGKDPRHGWKYFLLLHLAYRMNLYSHCPNLVFAMSNVPCSSRILLPRSGPPTSATASPQEARLGWFASEPAEALAFWCLFGAFWCFLARRRRWSSAAWPRARRAFYAILRRNQRDFFLAAWCLEVFLFVCTACSRAVDVISTVACAVCLAGFHRAMEAKDAKRDAAADEPAGSASEEVMRCEKMGKDVKSTGR